MLDSVSKPLLPLDSAATGSPDASGVFREGMSRVAAAVHVVTTDGPAGPGGLHGDRGHAGDRRSARRSSSASTPPAVRPAFVMENGVFCVNTLAAADRDLADAFAGRTDLQGPDRFAAGAWETLATGAPALRPAWSRSTAG